MSKIILKNMGLYLMHRNEEKDHKKGRPAILLKYKSQTSLIWWGTHRIEKNSDEQPLVMEFYRKTYFYSKGIEKIDNEDLKKRWIDYKTNEIYELNNCEQKELISAFTRFTNQKDPYQKIALLELENQMLKKENEMLRQKEERMFESEFEME